MITHTCTHLNTTFCWAIGNGGNGNENGQIFKYMHIRVKFFISDHLPKTIR